VDRNAWVNAMIQAGVPAEYGEVLRILTETIASGRGSRPNNDVLAATGKAPTHFADFAGDCRRMAPMKPAPRIELRSTEMPSQKYAVFQPAAYFDLVRSAWATLSMVHFFDIVTDDTIYEVLYDPGWPRIIQGRTDLMAHSGAM
jgi:hypothetical protein